MDGLGLARSGDMSEVLARAAHGDEAAFTALVAAHHPSMRRVAYVICRERELAEDACQQAWQIAWRRLSTVRDSTRLEGWLVTVAANEARKLVERRRRGRDVEARVAAIEPTTVDPTRDARGLDLGRAMGRLDARDRELLALRYVAGLNSFEIARLRGSSASGTRARLGRLLAKLRTELGDD